MTQRILLTLTILCIAGLSAHAQEETRFVGGVQTAPNPEAKPVRNDASQPGDEIVTLRHWKIKKGTFPEFYKASNEGVWPFFEKIGARVVGMWKVVHPEESTTQESPDYDEVYLMTRYASVAHWKATRTTTALGGNGPDWDKCREALEFRRSVTIETYVQFLQGHKWDNQPWFLPALDEEYERVK